MIGKANEVAVSIQGNTVQALLDTGSMVSTMAASLQTSLGLQILELDRMLTVEGAGGHRLPYLGYVEVDLFIKGMEEPTQKVVMLVVPDTAYHQRVPVLIGTNILGNLKQVVDGDPAWRIALASIAKHQAIVNTSASLGFLRTTKPVVVPPRSSVIIHGRTRVQSISQRISVCLGGNKSAEFTQGISGITLRVRPLARNIHCKVACTSHQSFGSGSKYPSQGQGM